MMIENCQLIESGYMFEADRNAEDEIRHAVMLLKKNGFSPESISTMTAAQMAVKISMELAIGVPSMRTLKKKTAFENAWMEK